jgi:hypothetical protein
MVAPRWGYPGDIPRLRGLTPDTSLFDPSVLIANSFLEGLLMKLIIATACLAVSLGLATHALADGRTVATLQQPVAKPTQFVVNNAIWDCEQSSCVADNAHDMYFGASECHDVAKHAGAAVAEFKSDAKTLQPTSLDRCNTGLEPKTTTASR